VINGCGYLILKIPMFLLYIGIGIKSISSLVLSLLLNNCGIFFMDLGFGFVWVI
jgi:hypothetical protein